MIGHWTCKPCIARKGHELVEGIRQILTIDQDLRPSADFGETNLGWNPLIIGDVHPCPGISIWGGEILMTKGLLLKPSDHVIEVPGGIPTSLEPVSRFLLYLSVAHQGRITNLSGAPTTRGISLRAAVHRSNISIEWVFVLADWASISSSSKAAASPFVRRRVRNNGGANVDCRHLSQTPLW